MFLEGVEPGLRDPSLPLVTRDLRSHHRDCQDIDWANCSALGRYELAIPNAPSFPGWVETAEILQENHERSSWRTSCPAPPASRGGKIDTASPRDLLRWGAVAHITHDCPRRRFIHGCSSGLRAACAAGASHIYQYRGPETHFLPDLRRSS
jgi:hypothetical protein